jgi:undecaprenyl-diphosphatase
MDSIIIFCAKYLFVAVPLLVILAWWQAGKPHKKQLIWAAVLAVVIAVVLDKVSGKLYYDPRPFTHGIKPLITHSADNGFPSEHTLFSVTLASVVFLFRRRLGLLVLAIALVVGIARAAAHVHAPIDIIGGAVLGAIAGAGGYYLAATFLDKKSGA